MLAPATAWAAARKSWIFGGFLRFLTRYRGILSDLSRPAKPGLLFADHGQPVAGSLPAADAIRAAGSRPAGHRIAVDGCRITASGWRAGMFEAWGAGHGAA